MTSVSAPETDVGPSVTKSVVRPAESPFLVGVQEYRSRRSAVERLFQGHPTPPGTPVSPENRSHVPLLARHGPYLTASVPPHAAVRTSSMGISVPRRRQLSQAEPRNAPAHARLSLQARRAPRQSSEQAERNRASLRSSLVLRR